MPRVASLFFVLGMLVVAACKKERPEAADAAPASGESAGLKEQDIKPVIREAKPMMEKCYGPAVAAKPEFSGKVTLVFAVNPDGTVDKKRAGLGGDVGGEQFAKCVLDVVVGLKFPTASAPTDVQMPLDLGKHAHGGIAADAAPAVVDARTD